MTSEDTAEIDFGTDNPDDAPSLDAKYAKQMRQIFPQKIELPLSTLKGMIESQINLAPSFQRREIWQKRDQSRFIESLIMNVPVPPVFLGEDQYSKYVVLDGRQRLTAIHEFLSGKYKLTGLTVWKELNGRTFEDLKEDDLDVTIMRRFLPAVLLLKESSDEVKYDVFDRLNSGGYKLDPMEIRNAIYRGPFTDLLHKCTETASFNKLWGIPTDKKRRKSNATYKRMSDLEIALRFFALTARHEAETDGEPSKEHKAYFSDQLSAYMKHANVELTRSTDLATARKANFQHATDTCHKIWGSDAFVPLGKSLRSAPLADGLMYGVGAISTSLNETSIGRIKSAIDKLQTDDPDFQKSLTSGTNGRSKIATRLRLARKAIEEAIA